MSNTTVETLTNDSYFPLLIRYANMQEDTVVLDPWDIKSGQPFVVLQVRYLQSSENNR